MSVTNQRSTQTLQDRQLLPAIDCHIHLAATGCCAPDAYLSMKLRRRYTIRLLKMLHGITDRHMDSTFDLDWPSRIDALLNQSSVIRYGVALGFDGYFDHGHGGEIRDKTQMIVPTDWVFQMCRQFKRLLPGPSLNPHRGDALDVLARCIEQKAVLIKWLPSAQGIDPAHPGLRRFYQMLADARLPLLVHIGGEKTFVSLNPEYNRISLMRQALDQGVKVICAHWGTPVHFSGEKSQVPELLGLIDQYPNLYFDNSGICNPSRYRHLPRLAQIEPLCCRTLYGSDFPVPSSAYYYLLRLGWRRARALEEIQNPFDRDVEIKRVFRVPDRTLTLAHEVLANLEYWISRNASSKG